MSLKVLVGSLAYSVTGGAFLTATQAAGIGIDPTWVLGTLVTILIAVFTAMGALIKIAYDTASKWETVLGGDSETIGFIERANDRHEELKQSQDRTYEQLRIQGQLLSELSYSFAEIAEQLNHEDDIAVDVDLDRIEDLHDEKQNKKWENDKD